MSQETGRWRRWGWKCPGADLLSGYIDGALVNPVRIQIELHLADCAACRSIVGDVVKMQRLEATPLPLGLEQRAIASPVANRKVRRWILIPAAAASLTVVLVVVALSRVPRNEISLIPRSPVAPIVAKSEIPAAPGGHAPNIVRRSVPSDSLPALIFPLDDKVLRPSDLILKWKGVAHARYYEIHVVTSLGDPVWQGDSERTDAKLPPDIKLSDGAYFVWIAAYLDDGRVQKSAPVRFRMNASR